MSMFALQELVKNVRRIVKIVNKAIIYQVLQLQYIQHSICKPLNRSVSILYSKKFLLGNTYVKNCTHSFLKNM